MVAFFVLFAREGMARADAGTATKAADLDLVEDIASILRERHVAGAALSLVDRDGVRLTRGIGWADVAARRPATRDTLFRVASISKILVGLSILMLVEEGRVSLETPIRELVPEVRFENPWESSSPVRVLHLLENTTGWDDLRPREFATEVVERRPLAEVLAFDPRSRTSRWPPGTYASYANAGPTVAAAIVEKIAGKPYETFVRERLFSPLRMPTSTFENPGSNDETRARSYGPDGRTEIRHRSLLFRPSAGLDASASEMGNLLSLFVNGGIFEGGRIVPTSALVRMETPTSTPGARLGLMTGYGLTSQALPAEGLVWRGHRGGFEGSSADFFYERELGAGYFLAISSDDDTAFEAIGHLVRARLAKDAIRREPSDSTRPNNKAFSTNGGFYEVANPRYERTRFWRSVLDLAYLSETPEGLRVEARVGHPARGTYVHVHGSLYLRPSESAATLVAFPEGSLPFVTPTLETPHWALRRIPTGIALLRLGGLGLSVAVLLSAIPVALFGGARRIRNQGKEAIEGVPLGLELAPVVAIAAVLIGTLCAVRSDVATLGRVGPCSVTVLASTLVFAVAALVTALSCAKLPRSASIARRIHALVLSGALLGLTGYLAYWGILGMRTWD
jgi:CubicO group peptidase (beta-lactamase class C family)